MATALGSCTSPGLPPTSLPSVFNFSGQLHLHPSTKLTEPCWRARHASCSYVCKTQTIAESFLLVNGALLEHNSCCNFSEPAAYGVTPQSPKRSPIAGFYHSISYCSASTTAMLCERLSNGLRRLWFIQAEASRSSWLSMNKSVRDDAGIPHILRTQLNSCRCCERSVTTNSSHSIPGLNLVSIAPERPSMRQKHHVHFS